MKRIGSMVIGAAIGAVLLLATAAPAAAQPAIQLNQEQVAAIQEINAYINSLRTLKGRFTQIGPSGEFAEGDFYLQRPGRMRFDYAKPNPILVIADGFWVGIEDRRLKSTQKYPISTTPLRFLLDEHVNLLEDARIVGFEDRGGELAVSVEARAGTTPGRLTLIFARNPLSLKQWTVVDAQGLTTQVAVFDLVAGANLNPKLFWINDNLIFDPTER